MQNLYPFFQDVHVMIFIGFGFLMTFIKTHRWTALSFNFILSIWALQWGILSNGFYPALMLTWGSRPRWVELVSQVDFHRLCKAPRVGQV